MNFIAERKIFYEKKYKGRTRFFISKKGDVTIEEFALEYYQNNGFEGLWSEDVYWWEIMALLYWDEISHNIIPGSKMSGTPFVSPVIPKNLAEKRTSTLKKFSSLDIELKRAWERRNREPHILGFDMRNIFNLEQFRFATRVLQSWQIVSIIERLINDFYKFRRGLPDLFLAREGIPLFAEVKRKGERISEPQSEWHEYLSNTVKVSVEICRVVEQKT